MMESGSQPDVPTQATMFVRGIGQFHKHVSFKQFLISTGSVLKHLSFKKFLNEYRAIAQKCKF